MAFSVDAANPFRESQRLADEQAKTNSCFEIVAVSLRGVGGEDENFLLKVYAGTRSLELRTGWTPEQREVFLSMQYFAQQNFYQRQFPGAEHWLICRDDVPAGQMILSRSALEIGLVDMVLLPEFQNLGTGSTLMAGLMEEARLTGKCIRLRVEPNNPALEWFLRLGFEIVSSDGIYIEMALAPVPRKNGTFALVDRSSVDHPKAG